MAAILLARSDDKWRATIMGIDDGGKSVSGRWLSSAD